MKRKRMAMRVGKGVLPTLTLALPALVLSLMAGASRAPSSPAPTGTDKTQVLGEQIKGNGGGNGQDKKSFRITGTVSDLFPGADESLNLTLENPNNFAISVTSVTVQVGNAGAGCTGSMLTVTNFSGALTVPKNGSANVSLPITMDPDAPAACENASWPLTYGGSAVKA